MDPLEKQICSKIRLGDEKAYEYLFKGYYGSLCAYAMDLLKSKDQSEEIVQEILIHMWENRSNLDINTSLKAYLYRTVHNQCINFLKHQSVIKNRAIKYVEEAQFSHAYDHSIDEELPNDQFFYDGFEEDILQTINMLPEQCGKIFRMSRFDGLRYEDISQKLNISVNTVKTQIRRALEKLRHTISLKVSKSEEQSVHWL